MRLLILLAGLLMYTALFGQSTGKGSLIQKKYRVTITRTDNYGVVVTRYGLIREDNNQEILPSVFERITDAGMDDKLLVQNSQLKYGLFDAAKAKWLLEPDFFFMNSYSEGILIASKKKESIYQYGAFDHLGNEVIPLSYSFLGRCSEGLMCFSNDLKRYGYINTRNEIIIPAQYANSGTFANGLAPAGIYDSSTATRYGFINHQNQWIIPASYVWVEDFAGKLAKVYTYRAARGQSYEHDKAGLINAKNQLIIPAEFMHIQPVITGRIYYVKNAAGKYGLYDSTGKELLPVKYKDIGFARGSYFTVREDSSKMGLMKSNGTWAFPPVYKNIWFLMNDAVSTERNGKLAVYEAGTLKELIPEQDGFSASTGGDHYYILTKTGARIYSSSGKLLNEIQQPGIQQSNTRITKDSFIYTYRAVGRLHDLTHQKIIQLPGIPRGPFNETGWFIAGDDRIRFYSYQGIPLGKKDYYQGVNFSEGIALVMDQYNSQAMFIDSSFKILNWSLQGEFHNAFSEGLMSYRDRSKTSYVFINKKGEQVFQVYAQNTGVCKNGRIRVFDKNNEYHLYDRTGKKITVDSYREMGDLNFNRAAIKSSGNLWGYIDSNGREIIPPQFEEAAGFFGKTTLVKSQGRYFLIDQNGKKINGESYKQVYTPTSNSFAVAKDRLFALIDENGHAITESKYDYVQGISENHFVARIGSKWQLLNAAGKLVAEPDCDELYAMQGGYCIFKKDNRFGLINSKGSVVLEPLYDQLSPPYNNHILSYQKEGKNALKL